MDFPAKASCGLVEWVVHSAVLIFFIFYIWDITNFDCSGEKSRCESQVGWKRAK
jgi:hypothetical protein